jgi:hypothetical protein
MESGELQVNMEIVNFLDSKGYEMDRWYDFPKEKTFGKKNPKKFKFDSVDEGKVKVLLSANMDMKGFWADIDQLKNFLFHPELFD